MRDVFTAQPTRRFIHGFFLYGTLMELSTMSHMSSQIQDPNAPISASECIVLLFIRVYYPAYSQVYEHYLGRNHDGARVMHEV